MKSILLMLLLLFMFVFNSHGQEMLYHKFTSANGLLSSDNYGVTQDKEGYIWIFSESGVLKYDGYQFKQFKSLNGLISNDVWDIQIDSKNRKWLNYFGRGIQYILNDKIYSIKGVDPTIQYFYSGEHEDTIFFKGGVNSASNFKRYYWTPGKPVKLYERYSKLNVQLLGDYRELGWMLLVNEHQQFLQNIKTGKIDTLDFRLKSIFGTYIHDSDRLFRENNGEFIWVLNRNGLTSNVEMQLTGTSFENVFKEQGSGNVILKKSKIEAYSKYEMGTRNLKLELLLNKLFDSPLQLGNLFEDNEGNLWVTKKRGEIYFFPSFWKSIIEPELNEKIENDKNVISPLRIGQNIVYLTKSSRLFTLNTESNSFAKSSKDFSALTIRRIRQDSNKLYINATYRFLIASLNQKGEIICVDKNIPIKPAYDFDFLSKDSILLGNGDLLLLNSFTVVENYFQLPLRVSNLLTHKSWLIYSLNNGVEAINLVTKQKKHFPISNVAFIKEFSGKVMIGTKGGGCHYFSSQLEKLASFLNGYEINDIVQLNSNWLIATNRGVIIAKVKGKRIKITNVFFGQKKLGIQINAICPFDDKIYLFTSHGIKIIAKELLFAPRNNFNFSINKVRINGVEQTKRGLKFEAGNNYLEIHLGSISFWNLEEHYFRYKLHGLNEKWSVTADKVIKFANLKPGKYKLEVGVSNFPLGEFNSMKFIEFEVLPTMLSKWWVKMFFVLGVVVLMVIVALIVRKIVTMRERRQRDLKSLKLKAITAQLNPHFVFNSLNTIQSLVILKSDYEANKYIGAFAGLMRKVLDSSMAERISLKEEIQFLNNYLELENQRLNETLEYSVNYSEQMNTNTIFVYSMVFQPIVENAIVHGLLNKKGRKKINIEFEILDEVLVATIIDNGIGRVASAEINKSKVNKSWSSTILKEKMQLLNHRKKKELEIEIIDLLEHELNSGTKVIVRMKIQNEA